MSTRKKSRKGNPKTMTHQLHLYIHTKRMGDAVAVKQKKARKARAKRAKAYEPLRRVYG